MLAFDKTYSGGIWVPETLLNHNLCKHLHKKCIYFLDKKYIKPRQTTITFYLKANSNAKTEITYRYQSVDKKIVLDACHNK